MDIDDRPTKKRRFFSDDGGATAALSSSSAIPSSRPTSSASSTNDHDSSHTSDIEHDGPDTGTDGFDEATFRAFVGEDELSEDVVQKVKDAAGGNLERAVNMYFEGSWKTTIAARQTHLSAPSRTIQGWASSTNEPTESARTPVSQVTTSPPAILKRMPHERYVGSFGVAAWTTKSGTNILAAGEPVKIERSRIQPKTKLGRGGKVVQVIGRKSDVVTRFTNQKGEELGRLPEDAAKWVSTLLDQSLCRFEGHAIFAPERVRVNDTVYLQLRCYMLKTAFEASAFVKPRDDNRAAGIFEEKESSEEKDLRLRQFALVKLFDEINLQSTTTNEAVAKNKKQSLLRAAEIAEQHDQEAATKTKIGNPTAEGATEVEAEEGVELEEDQLDALYQKAQTFDFNTPEAEPANSFALDLRKYQKQALHWMLSKERDQKLEHKESSLHPLWEEYAWPSKDADDKPLPLVDSQHNFYVNLYSGELSLNRILQEDHCLGGILADEMGLGKTIEMFSLMHSHRSDVAQAAVDRAASKSSPTSTLQRLPHPSSGVQPAPCTTLVVAPMSLLSQWESEAIKSSKPGTMKSLVYYGNEKSINLQTLCSAANALNAPNVIITSYGVVLSEFNQVASAGGDRGSGLFAVEFFRVILDEAHTIKNRQAKTSKACYELAAKHRWVLTGTPIVNRLEDLFSLVRFLRVEPWNNFSFWKTFITVPFESRDFVRALNVVQTVLEPLVIRRTKDMKTPEGEYLVPLPKKVVKVVELELSKSERAVYDLVFTRAKRAFNDSLQAGTLLKSYTTIFAQILRLRQSCCHPVLTRNKDLVADEEERAIAAAAGSDGFADDMDLQELISRFTADTQIAEEKNKEAADESNITFTTHALRQIQNESSGECPLCLESQMQNPAVTACWHSACRKCLENHMDFARDRGELPRCFACRETINPRDVFEVVRHINSRASPTSSSDGLYGDASTDEAGKEPPRISLRRLNPYSPTAATSAKIAALLEHLSVLPKTTKSVVFSQFTSFLDLISPQLTRHNIHHVRLDGTLSQKQRSAVLKEFTAENASDPNAPSVLLLSLRAGGVGLNLTAASRCYFMDPWWAYAVELQAQDRIHRMGQTSSVEVIRFIIKESIEGRMLRVQEKKMAVAGSLGIGHGQGEGGEEERKRRRIEDLQELLG